MKPPTMTTARPMRVPREPQPNVSSFAVKAFGRDTLNYHTFIKALASGLAAYERQQGKQYGQAPLSVA